MNLFSLKGKTALVTGSEGGLGKAIVKGFEKAGAKVEGLDIKNGDDVRDFFIIKHPIDILVNCAGIANGAWEDVIGINLLAPVELCLLALGAMPKGGSIINITSLWAERGFVGNIGYGASKGGLKMVTKCLAMEYAKYNIRVNNLIPGYFKTDMTKHGWENNREKITSCIPMGRWGEPGDIVGAAIFLASDASKYITGADIPVDGGWLARGL